MSVHTALKTETLHSLSHSTRLFSFIYFSLSVLLLTLPNASKATGITSTGLKKERGEDSKTAKRSDFCNTFCLYVREEVLARI